MSKSSSLGRGSSDQLSASSHQSTTANTSDVESEDLKEPVPLEMRLNKMSLSQMLDSDLQFKQANSNNINNNHDDDDGEVGGDDMSMTSSNNDDESITTTNDEATVIENRRSRNRTPSQGSLRSDHLNVSPSFTR